MTKQEALDYAKDLQDKVRNAGMIEPWSLAEACRFLLTREITQLEQEIAAETQTEGGVG